MSNPIVTFETNQGTIKAELFPDVAPNTVNNFISLVKRGFLRRTYFSQSHSGFHDSRRRPSRYRHGRPRLFH